MKNKSFLMKILVCGCFLLILLLLIIIFSLIRMFVPEKEKVEKSIITNYYELDNIENISFDFRKANSVFKTTNGNKLAIVQNSKEERFYLNYKEQNNQLFFDEDMYIIKPQKKKYIVYIPEKYLNKVTIINGFGKIKIDGIVNDIDINNNSGPININKIGNIRIKDVSGNINIKNILGDVEISSSTGNININKIKGKATIDSITGDITVYGFDTIGNSFFENVSGDIILEISKESVCKINYYNETGKNKINDNICYGNQNIIDIKNITGMIKIN